jgi:hypothetical protein
MSRRVGRARRAEPVGLLLAATEGAIAAGDEFFSNG